MIKRKDVATFLLQDIYNITGIGPVLVGKIGVGPLMKGMHADIEGKIVAVATIEAHHNPLQSANTGDSVGISIKWENKPVQAPQGFFKKMFSSNDSELANTLQKYKGKIIEFN